MNRRVGALCLALCLLLGAGCAASPEDTNSEYSEYLMAMDTLMTLTAYGPQAEEGVTQARAVITALEGLLSVTDENSEAWAINHSGGASVTVQADTAALLDLSLDLAQKTGGALDPTIYPVLRAWGFTTDQKRCLARKNWPDCWSGWITLRWSGTGRPSRFPTVWSWISAAWPRAMPARRPPKLCGRRG